jgi:hypothetical protein
MLSARTSVKLSVEFPDTCREKLSTAAPSPDGGSAIPAQFRFATVQLTVALTRTHHHHQSVKLDNSYSYRMQTRTSCSVS